MPVDYVIDFPFSEVPMELELLLYIVGGLAALSGVGFVVLRKPKQLEQKTPTPEKNETSTTDKIAETTESVQAQEQQTTIQTEATPQTQTKVSTPEKARSDLKTLEEALAKTKAGFWGKVKSAFSSSQTIGSAEIEDLEEALYTSDLGPKTVDHLIQKVSSTMNTGEMTVDELHSSLKNELNAIFNDIKKTELSVNPEKKTTVWMVVGVNGAGKTTTIGKLASQQVEKGKRVLIAAGDTFRAAADEQLKVWATRAEVEIFSPEGIKDPSAVAFDAVQKGAAKDFDLVIIDTAGRLHTQKNLMEELKKMKRVMGKALEGSPDETILVLDANSGQNALMQTEQFHQALEVTGVILTKMDGSAKGGVAVGIACEHSLPIRMIGVGQNIEDLRPFNSTEFVDSIL